MKNELLAERFFLDTNVVVYSFDAKSPRKREKANELIAEALAGGKGVISHQVIQEFVSVASAKFRKSFDEERLTLYLDEVLFTLWKSYPSREGYLAALEIQARHKVSWWDALMLASAVEAGCRTLFSEDFQDGFRISTLKVVNPFA